MTLQRHVRGWPGPGTLVQPFRKAREVSLGRAVPSPGREALPSTAGPWGELFSCPLFFQHLLVHRTSAAVLARSWGVPTFFPRAGRDTWASLRHRAARCGGLQGVLFLFWGGGGGGEGAVTNECKQQQQPRWAHALATQHGARLYDLKLEV